MFKTRPWTFHHQKQHALIALLLEKCSLLEGGASSSRKSPRVSEKPRNDFPGGEVTTTGREGSDSCSLSDSLCYLLSALQKGESYPVATVNHPCCSAHQLFRLRFAPSKPWGGSLALYRESPCSLRTQIVPLTLLGCLCSKPKGMGGTGSVFPFLPVFYFWVRVYLNTYPQVYASVHFFLRRLKP